MLKPDEDDYLVLKPKNSGFYSTILDVLLKELHAKHLIVTGIATNICILYTVHDAHSREYEISVPQDCVAAQTEKLNRFSLEQMHTLFKASTLNSPSIKF
jgi:nicotinamidase-related amidase